MTPNFFSSSVSFYFSWLKLSIGETRGYAYHSFKIAFMVKRHLLEGYAYGMHYSALCQRANL